MHSVMECLFFYIPPPNFHQLYVSFVPFWERDSCIEIFPLRVNPYYLLRIKLIRFWYFFR